MSEAQIGQTLIKQGMLTEVRPGKFGDTLIFQEENGEEVGLGAGGQLKSLYTRGKLRIGLKYQIVFNGKKALKDGIRTANDFIVGEYDSAPESEMTDEAQDFLEGNS
jgi:hypothetical protein